MGNFNTKDEYDDYNAPNSAGIDRHGTGGYSTYGDGDGSSVVESFMSDMFGNVRPNVYDRLALNISPDPFGPLSEAASGAAGLPRLVRVIRRLVRVIPRRQR